MAPKITRFDEQAQAFKSAFTPELFELFKDSTGYTSERTKASIFTEQRIIEVLLNESMNSEGTKKFLSDEVFKRELTTQFETTDLPYMIQNIVFKMSYEPQFAFLQKLLQATRKVLAKHSGKNYKPQSYIDDLDESLKSIYLEQLISYLKRCKTEEDVRTFSNVYISQPYLRADWNEVEELDQQFKDSSAFQELAEIVQDIKSGKIHSDIVGSLASPYAYTTSFYYIEEFEILLPLRPFPTTLTSYFYKKISKYTNFKGLFSRDNEENELKDMQLREFISSVDSLEGIEYDIEIFEPHDSLRELRPTVNTHASYLDPETPTLGKPSTKSAEEMKSKGKGSNMQTASGMKPGTQAPSSNSATSNSEEESEESVSQEGALSSPSADNLVKITLIDPQYHDDHSMIETINDLFTIALENKLLTKPIDKLPTVQFNGDTEELGKLIPVMDSILDSDELFTIKLGFSSYKYLVYTDKSRKEVYLVRIYETNWHF